MKRSRINRLAVLSVLGTTALAFCVGLVLLSLPRERSSALWLVSLAGASLLYSVLFRLVRQIYGRDVRDRTLQTYAGSPERPVAERTLELQRQTERLTKLTTLIQTVTALLDTQRVFQSVVEGTLQLLQVSMARIWVVDPLTGDAVLGATTSAPDLPKNIEEFPTRVPKGQGAVGWAIAHREAHYTPRVADDPLLWSVARGLGPAGFVSMLVVPLLQGNRALGALALFTREPREFSEEEQEILSTFAAAAALAIEKAQLHEGIQQQLKQTETLLAVSRLVGSTLDLGEIARRATREMVKILGADLGGAWRFTLQGNSLTPLAGYHVPKELFQIFSGTPLCADDPLVDRAKRLERPVFSSEGQRDLEYDHPLARLIPHKSLLVAPIRSKGEIIGGFAIMWTRQVHNLSADELRLVEGISAQTAVAIENVRLLEAERAARDQLAVSESRYRDLFENALDLVYLHDLDGNIRAINEAGVMISGYPREELLQMDMKHLMSPEDWTRHADIVRQMVAGGSAAELFTVEIIRKDGARVPLECRARLVPENGRPAGVQGVARDITVRRKLERRQEAFVDIVKELAAEDDFQRIFSLIALRANELTGADSVVISLVEGDEVVLKGSYGIDRRDLVTQGRKLLEDRITRVIQSRRPFASSDMATDPHWRDSTLVRALNYRAALDVPIMLREEVIGVLGVLHRSPRTFSQEDVAILLSLAGHTAIALERTNLLRKLESRLGETQTLLSISQAISSTLDLTETMRRVARETARALGADMVGAYLADPNHDSLHPIAGYHVPKHLLEQFMEFSIPLKGHPALEEAWVNQRPVYSTDAQSDPRVDPEVIQHFPQRTVLFFPMVVKGEPIGGLFATWWEQEHRFTPEELRLVEGISRQAAIAIENARLYEQHRKMVERLRLFAQSLRSIGEAVAINDLDGKIVFVNEAFTRMHGWAEDEVLGQPVSRLPFHERRAEIMTQIVAATWQGGWQGELLAQRKSGEEFPIFLTTAPVFNDEGQPVAIVGVARDLSQEKLLQAQLIQAEKLATTGELAAGVAHEINNPLTVILGNASLAAKKAQSKELFDDLAAIQAEALRAAKIVRDLLTFARPAPDEKTPLDLNEVLKQTLGLQSYHLSTDNIEVVWNLATPLPKTLADQSQLQQVILNLIVNAHQAIKGHRDHGTLWIATGVSDDRVWATIRDDGPGIPPELLPRIFDPFLTTKPVGQGTGLGLSVSYGIVQAHGGQLTVESKVGHGATFALVLPVITGGRNSGSGQANDHSEEAKSESDPALLPSR